jgi:hypothetical protein
VIKNYLAVLYLERRDNMNKQEALKFLNNLPEDTEVSISIVSNPPYVTSGYVINTFNISRQVLSYWSRQGYVKTIDCGKQKRYLLDDIKKLIK